MAGSMQEISLDVRLLDDRIFHKIPTQPGDLVQVRDLESGSLASADFRLIFYALARLKPRCCVSQDTLRKLSEKMEVILSPEDLVLFGLCDLSNGGPRECNCERTENMHPHTSNLRACYVLRLANSHAHRCAARWLDPKLPILAQGVNFCQGVHFAIRRWQQNDRREVNPYVIRMFYLQVSVGMLVL